MNGSGVTQINNLLGNSGIIPDGDFSHIKTSNLYHYVVPIDYVNKKYNALFEYLVKERNMIPLGLYRTEMVSFSFLDEDNARNGGARATARRKTIGID